GGLVALLLIELVVLWPFPAGTPAPPGLVPSWRGAPGAVLHLPTRKRQIGNLAMYYQTAHGRPIVGGYIHRELPGMDDYKRALDAILAPTDTSEGADGPTPAEVRGLLAGLDIGHALAHRAFVNPAQFAATQARLTAALGPAVADAGDALVFVVPAVAWAEGSLAAYDVGLDLAHVQVEPAAVRPGEAVTVTLEWRASARPAAPYTVFIHLLDARGERAAQQDGQPLGGRWPTTLWAPGERLLDQHVLHVGAAVPPGVYDLGIGLYGPRADERAGVTGAHVRDGMAVVPGAVEVR
ncbi:MAG: hypothetical protein V1772_06120, partial [Chloroflexota bacterium]